MDSKVYCLIRNICIKLFLSYLIIKIIFEEKYQKIDVDKLENYYTKIICKFLYFTINYDCPTKISSSSSFYDEILEINTDINLLINIKQSKVENIFLLLGIIPFLKNNSTLSYKINNKEIDIFLKKTFNTKRIKHKIIKFDFIDFNIFKEKINELLNYNWELVPEKFILDNLRYIINNYYNETNFKILEKSMYMNYKSYIQRNNKKMTYKEIKSLLSKYSH
jgi:hypothetical protein